MRHLLQHSCTRLQRARTLLVQNSWTSPTTASLIVPARAYGETCMAASEKPVCPLTWVRAPESGTALHAATAAQDWRASPWRATLAACVLDQTVRQAEATSPDQQHMEACIACSSAARSEKACSMHIGSRCVVLLQVHSLCNSTASSV